MASKPKRIVVTISQAKDIAERLATRLLAEERADAHDQLERAGARALQSLWPVDTHVLDWLRSSESDKFVHKNRSRTHACVSASSSGPLKGRCSLKASTALLQDYDPLPDNYSEVSDAEYLALEAAHKRVYDAAQAFPKLRDDLFQQIRLARYRDTLIEAWPEATDIIDSVIKAPAAIPEPAAIEKPLVAIVGKYLMRLPAPVTNVFMA
jgi:hypothetical protein